MKNLTQVICLLVFSFFTNSIKAQPNRTPQPVVLEAGDTAVFAPAPAGFDASKEGIAHGKTDTVVYNSATVGTQRRAMIYLPPGYSAKNKYPVLYLLHGIGGNEKEWYRYCRPDYILDNLLADKKIKSMIVVFPNGRAMQHDSDTGNIYAPEKIQAFANFEKDLLNDLIPFIETSYAVQKTQQSRAIAGFSMGGGQSLNFGLGHPEEFAYVGGFSAAPNTKKPEELIPDAATIKKQIKLLYIACGNKDGLISISRSLHYFLQKNNVPHIYHIQPGGHNIDPWKQDLYNFSQRIFR